MKTKAHPAVHGARFSDEQTKSFASGVTLRESIRYDIYVGTADALVAAGLMLAGQFPGQLQSHRHDICRWYASNRRADRKPAPRRGARSQANPARVKDDIQCVGESG